MKKYWPVILCILLFGCGPNFYLRKAERALKKAEQLGAVIDADTVWKTIEIPVPYVTTDTVFTSQVGDTVIIRESRVQVKYVRLKGDSVFIEGECLPDTIEVMVPTIVNREIKARGKGWTFYAAWILILALVFFVFGWIMRGKKGDLIVKFDREPPPDQQ